jgi:hypothetical protein
MTKKCKSCQSEIDAKAKKCPHCRADQRSWFVRHPILTTFLVLFIALVGFSALSGGNKTANNTVSSTSNTASSQQEVAQKSQPTPTPDTHPHFRDGSYQVGKDLQPGTYRTREASSGCYFARLSGFGGSLDEILANENTDAPTVVTILPTDKGFTSSRCGTWTQDLSAITKSKTSFGDGTYIVGTDIEPGTYKSSGQSGCYYARLSGFGGSLDDILANQNTNTAAIVTIAATDKGFKSNHCGTWTKE